MCYRRSTSEIDLGSKQHDVCWRQFASDQAGWKFEAAADGSVKALGDQVHLAVVKVPVRHDGRVLSEEVAEQGHDVLAPEGVAHADFQCAGSLSFRIRQIGDRALDGGQAAADFGQEARTGFGQAQAARTALKQADAQAGFEPGHVLAHSG